MHDSHATPESLVRLAIEHFEQNRLPSAEQSCREALALDSQNSGALGVLGLVLHAQSRYNEAESAFLMLTRLEPMEAAHWINVGTARRCQMRYDESLQAFTRAAELGANSADFFYNVALAHMDRKDFESARAVLKKAMALAPLDAEIRFRYALCCYERQDTDAAIESLAQWDGLSGLTSALISNIGLLLVNLGQVQQADRAVLKAAAEGASDPQTLLILAKLYERTNRVSEARATVERLLKDSDSAALGPDLIELQGNIAQREGDHAAAAEYFTTALNECTAPNRGHFYLFSLTKSLDALGRYDAAFAALEEAHASQVELVRLSMPLMHARGAPTMTITEFSCDPEDIVQWRESDGPSLEHTPIFIVGFPRSGTTLLEQALDAHPALRSMDEQPFLQNAIDDLMAKGVRYPDRLGGTSRETLDEVRSNYWRRVGTKVQLQAGQRLVDKNPLNMLRLPIIRRLFPRARIILAIRHPCDVILSCFMQHFRAPDFVLLCRDLTSLTHGYRRTFDFWYQQEALLRPQCHELRYEALVESFEQHARDLVNFLELPWNDRVLRPGERALEKKYISTPSYSQVVQPINQKAVGRWRRYERHFAPVLPIIQPYLDRWGYDA